MAHKRFENDLIRTTNGVDTLTAPIYVRELKTFTPLENGFNRELALYVLDWIRANMALWDQGSWREIFEIGSWRDDESEPIFLEGEAPANLLQRIEEQYPDLGSEETLSKAADLMLSDLRRLATNVHTTLNPTCGTAMCLAGWVSELTAVDWVIDAGAFSLTSNWGHHTRKNWAEVLFVPRESPLPKGEIEMLAYSTWTDMHGTVMPDVLVQHAQSRGFTFATHRTTSVLHYAAEALGLTPVAFMPVFFDGQNTFEDLEFLVDHYTEHGPDTGITTSELPSRLSGEVEDD